MAGVVRQLWSVWDSASRMYKVYESLVAFRHPSLGPKPDESNGSSPMGSAPEEVLPGLPSDARFLHESLAPVGRIAAQNQARAGVSVLLVLVGGYLLWRLRRRRRGR